MRLRATIEEKLTELVELIRPEYDGVDAKTIHDRAMDGIRELRTLYFVSDKSNICDDDGGSE